MSDLFYMTVGTLSIFLIGLLMLSSIYGLIKWLIDKDLVIKKTDKKGYFNHEVLKSLDHERDSNE